MCSISSINTRHQGLGSQVVILVIMRDYEGDDTDEDLGFFFVSNRITVALSRSKDGLIIVGNFSLLLQNEVWNRFITTATQYTSKVKDYDCERQILI